MTTLHLEFDDHEANHLRAFDWLQEQADPTTAVVQLIQAAHEGEHRLNQLEELAMLLANEARTLKATLAGKPAPEKKTPREEVHEDPESARRLDSMFGL